jgi:hypothetical protein
MALELDPHHAEAHCNLATLLNGKVMDGWRFAMKRWMERFVNAENSLMDCWLAV